jgi:1-acyl-sn-glycerol-3-phosphate acyltransferase
MDSRSTSFAEEILERTKGRGVDVVLNSLAGEAIPKGLEILAPYGRFVEIGKRDIYGDSRIGLLAFRKNLSFFAVDLDRLCNERTSLAGEMLREVVARFERGQYQPLPHRIFPASEAEPAIRFMAQAKHIGKVVLDMRDPELRVELPRTGFRDNATYLISGGLGGFGLVTSEWMAERGAGAIALVGRTAPGPEAQKRIDALAAAGTCVRFLPADISRAEEVRRVMVLIRGTMPPLRGVVHAAMALDDAPLAEMTPERLERVLAPKLAGAWNLHLETLADDLDMFVCYSSLSAILGNPRQSNYSAANAFLDALAHHRRALGRPALTINWGVVRDAGYVAEHAEIRQYLEGQGYASFSAAAALGAFALLLRQDMPQAVVARIDWQRLAAAAPSVAASASFRHFVLAERSAPAGQRQAGSIRSKLDQIGDAAERTAMVEQYLRDELGKILGMPPQRIDPESRLTEIGLDSLIAVELTTLLSAELGAEIPTIKLIQGVSVRTLAGLVLAVVPQNAALPPAVAIAAISERAAPSLEPRKAASHPRPALAAKSPAVAVAERAPAVPFVPAEPIHLDGSVNGRAVLEPQRWSTSQLILKGIARTGFALVAKIRVEGKHNMPTDGAFIIAVNHLSVADVPLVFSIMDRPVVLLAAEWLQERAFTRWLVGDLGRAIFVQRGQADRVALDSALAVLRAGGILGLSPEGTRSKTGRLGPAHSGVAYLASQAGVPVVPVALWGQERMVQAWTRLNRPEINIHIGEPLRVPMVAVSAPELDQNTDRIMRALAALLPEAYRGAYL